MKRLATGVLLVLGLTVMVANAHAFDGKHRGFLLGGGLGVGVDTVRPEISDRGDFIVIRGDDVSYAALGTDFKIGGGVSERTMLYFHSQGAWFGDTDVNGDDVTYSSGVAGLGVTWFTSSKPHSFFLTGTMGIASLDLPFEDDFPEWTSFGVILGVGYEFARHWSVDGSFVIGAPDRTESGITGRVNSVSLLFTVTALAY